MQMTFHNTKLAFVALNLDDDPDGLERRCAELEYCLAASGIIQTNNEITGVPSVSSAQHVFLMGNFGIKTVDKCQGASKNTWKGKWANARYGAEFEELSKKNPVLDEFEELDSNYPATSRRKIKATESTAGGGSITNFSKEPKSPSRSKSPSFNAVEEPLSPRKLSGNFISQFTEDFDVANLFDPKVIKKEGEPSFEDRIFYRTLKDYVHLIEPGRSSSCEGVRSGTHVPVYSTFRLCGVDNSLLKRWQVITGNLPVETASRTDTQMVTGVVEQLLSELFEKSLNDQALERAAQEQERAAQELLAQMRRCDRCTEPLNPLGGDVELGDKGAFHRACYTCEDCGKDLMGQKLLLVDGKWLCYDSFNRLYHSACPRCHKYIDGERIRVGKAQISYHFSCFKCTVCDCNLVDNGQVKDFLDIDGKPFCEPHFEFVKNKCCAACKKTIDEGDRVRPGVNFHKKCYECSVCSKNMDTTNMRIYVRDFKVFCEIDHLKDVLAREKKVKYLEEKVAARKLAEEEEESRVKEAEMMKRRISMIPKGFDASNYDVPEDGDIEEEDDDD